MINHAMIIIILSESKGSLQTRTALICFAMDIYLATVRPVIPLALHGPTLNQDVVVL